MNGGGKTIILLVINLVGFMSLNYVFCGKYKNVLHVYKVQTHNYTLSFLKPEASLRDRRTSLEVTSEDNIFC